MLHFPPIYSLLTASVIIFLSAFSLPFARADQSTPPLVSLKSPNGKLAVDFQLTNGSPTYSIQLNNQPILLSSSLGLIRDDEDFSKNLTLQSASTPTLIEDHYELLTAKRRLNTYRANRQTFHLLNANHKPLDLTFQLSDDGIAFRYSFPDSSSTLHTITSELTSFHFLPDTKAFLQPMQVAKSGWQSSNPAYEEYYQKEIPVGTPSTLGAGWVFPALFKTGDKDGTWIALTEASLGRSYCACHLADKSPDANYSIALADPRETIATQLAAPHSTLPWATPWRIIAIGSLKTITESTLGTDLADPPSSELLAATKSFINPGQASWSWPLLGDHNTTFDVQKKFIDYAADMHWSYCLIDALWDTQIGYDKIKQLCDYAAGKNVGILLWYNSAGDWNTTPQTPRNKMLTHESRLAEFQKIKDMGVKGVKIDFFGGDGQPFINYYQDILDDAAQFQLMVNFHGATLPRGWQRTYPHLMTMEAIRGFEYITFEQANADQEPSHAAMLPFTRNLFDPMDFTPVCLDHINNKVKRRTTSAFELALSILFTSGIQHFPETPEGMNKMPDYIQSFMKQIPASWDDTQFIDGYPGKFAVLARKGNNHWFIAGINATPKEMPLTLNLSTLPTNTTTATLFTDAPTPALFTKQEITLPQSKSLSLTLSPTGGFVLELK